jgi:mono/diheme cytochrome c family protein
MDTRFGLLPVVGLLALSAPLPTAAQNAAGSSQVTFTKDIAPILQRSCQTCHRPDSVAPMSLLAYEDVRPWARSIKARVSLGPRSGVMPPWFVEKNVGIQNFKADPSLSADEIAKIAKWVDSGAPRGNPADMPAPRKFTGLDEWQIGTPDLIVKTPLIEMKGTSPDWWGSIGEIPSGVTEDKYVAAVEYKERTEFQGDAASSRDRAATGARFIVHHLCWGARAPGADPNDFAATESFPCHEVGRNADIFAAESPRLLKVGSNLAFSSTHLHAAGRDAKSYIEIGFKFVPKDQEPTKKVRRMGLFGNSLNLDIKPMEANQRFDAYTTLEQNAKIISYEPHMHAAGVRMCMDAIWGSGISFETLSCVGYDHGWVRTYVFDDHAAPLLPKGTILRISGYFDNTPANKNVADPRNWSGLGHRSIDNMMNQLGEIVYLTDEEFEHEMAVRRTKLGLKDGQTVLGCPLCSVRQTQPSVTGRP